jgi:hypothetical protein
MNDEYKEVYFCQYCNTCKHKDTPEAEDPCHECLGNPANVYSHRPVKWEAKE